VWAYCMHRALHDLTVIPLDIPQDLSDDCIDSSIPHGDGRHLLDCNRVENAKVVRIMNGRDRKVINMRWIGLLYRSIRETFSKPEFRYISIPKTTPFDAFHFGFGDAERHCSVLHHPSASAKEEERRMGPQSYSSYR
jgi:hypothetical protein